MIEDITLEDLMSCPWREIIDKSPKKDCLDYYELFYKYKNDKKIEIKPACQLLGEICSMCLFYDRNEVFAPMHSDSQGRTMLPQDLTENHIEILYKFLKEIDDPELKARIADLIWIRKGKYKIESANIAIDEYIKSFENLKINNEYNAIVRLCRAVNLAYEIKSKEKQEKILDIVEKYVMNIDDKQVSGFHYELFKILDRKKYGNLQEIANKCYKIICYNKSVKNYHLMREFLEIYYNFRRYLDKDFECLQNIKIEEAESYVLEANNSFSAMKKTYLLRLAIESLRKIQNSKKNLIISNRINVLHAQLITEQQNIPKEMKFIKTPDTDITQLVKETESFISGISFYDAIIRLSNIINIPDEKKLREEALLSLKEQLSPHLCYQVFINDKGKTVGKIPPTDVNNLSLSDDIVKVEVFKKLHILFSLYVETKILPAIEVISREHLITLDDLIIFLKNNIFIPDGYQLLFARGFLAGFKKDFVSSALFLVPLVENSIRNILEYYGHVVTSKYSTSGIQKEKDLNELLVDEHVIQIFGKDIIFVLRFVMTENYGANFRNLLAHGLHNYNQLQSPISIFCWWLILHLLLMPIPIQSTLSS